MMLKILLLVWHVDSVNVHLYLDLPAAATGTVKVED